jgi:hypothetical protein
MKGIFTLALVASTVFLFNSCKKYEGEGGKSTINGKIMIDEKLYVNGNYSETVSYVGADEDVFIVYGTGDVNPDDKIECSYDGSFKFDYLQPGTYTIYAYSEIFNKGANATNNDDDYYTKEVVSQTIELGKKEDLDLGTITLIK